VKEPLFWGLVAVSLIVSASAYVQLVSYLAMPVSIYLLRIAALCVFLISAYALLWSMGGREIPLRAAAFFMLLLVFFVLVRTEVRLNYIQACDPREPMVGAAISPEVLELAQKAAEFSSHLQGDPKVMPWQVDERLEIPLGWYLRHFEQVSYISRVTSVPEDVGVILPAGAPPPAKYVGMHFGLRSSWPGGKYPLLEWLRWWMGLRTALPAPQTEEVVLWVRSALQR
ncbi:MAG: hypothetical protein H5T63_09100, partial [Chloroflexi bacterium]|nr:hypothetical protein [Chloroflexota bacterium]